MRRGGSARRVGEGSARRGEAARGGGGESANARSKLSGVMTGLSTFAGTFEGRTSR